ncbi:hypothetical protein [Deinococcus xianganensis]|uniref:Lipoprotein n=1 Tax=Deinococcus xianganensis TaxID=1507289 RepID=A0A6I4YK03_9DEIO|nr:hypothetical protein [Deinococcus xianganensis]MXV20291.1 hypothetical protein [Deinococcus xianganensis]
MRNVLLIGLVLLGLGSCKKQEAQPAAAGASAPATGAAEQATGTTAFARASDQYLIDTKAVKTDCAGLLGEQVYGVVQKMSSGPSGPVCGRMTLGADTTREMIDIAHGRNQASPWEDGSFTSGIFAIEDSVTMTVMLFPTQSALVLVQ